MLTWWKHRALLPFRRGVSAWENHPQFISELPQELEYMIHGHLIFPAVEFFASYHQGRDYYDYRFSGEENKDTQWESTEKLLKAFQALLPWFSYRSRHSTILWKWKDHNACLHACLVIMAIMQMRDTSEVDDNRIKKIKHLRNSLQVIEEMVDLLQCTWKYDDKSRT